ncbi:MAG: hypothetical protein ACP5NY_04110 [Thermocladium sp.]
MSVEAQSKSAVDEAAQDVQTVVRNNLDRVYIAASRAVKACKENSEGLVEFLECINDIDEDGVRDAAKSLVLGVINQSTGLKLTWGEAMQAASEGKLSDLLVKATS